MKELETSHRSPKSDGSEGWVYKYDTDQKMLKYAMITIVFTGMWLEAFLHHKIVEKYSKEKFHEYDYRPYEDKLKLLNISDTSIENNVKRFRNCRKELVHEKSYLDSGEIRIAEKEAENAYGLLQSISNTCP